LGDDFISASHCTTLKIFFLELSMQHSEDLIINLLERKRFLARMLIKIFSIRIGQDKHWITLLENCKELVQSNALQAAVGHGCLHCRKYCHSHKFVMQKCLSVSRLAVEYSFLCPLVQKYNKLSKHQLQLKTKTKVAHSYGSPMFMPLVTCHSLL